MNWQLVHMKAAVIVVASVLHGGNIIAHWPAEGNADDIVGGNDGTLVGGASFGSGKVGQAFDLTGPSDLVRMSQPIQFAQGDDFTVNFWVNQAETPPEQNFMIETRKGQFYGFTIGTLADNLLLAGGRCDNGNLIPVRGSPTINNGRWHHIATVFDWGADELRLYIDGCLELTSSLCGCDGFTQSDKLFVGAVSNQDDFYNFNGLVDELQVYKRALTDLDIKFIFEQAGDVAVCGRDCNGNGIPDGEDIADGTSLDCNRNAVPDECDIADGTAFDCDGNGVLDQCESLLGDLDGNDHVGPSDLLLLLSDWGRCVDCDDCQADINCDCTVGTSDLIVLLGNWS